MTVSHKMDDPDRRNRLDHMVQGVLGTEMDRPDGPMKVSGGATYAHDGQIDGMLHGVLVRATVSKGTLDAMDAAAVEAMRGVRAVIHGPRFLRNPAQGTANKAPVQDSKGIAYFGQPVALVVADTFEQARHGAQTLHLQISPEAATVNVADARTETPEGKQSSQGDLDTAMVQAAFTVDET